MSDGILLQPGTDVSGNAAGSTGLWIISAKWLQERQANRTDGEGGGIRRGQSVVPCDRVKESHSRKQLRPEATSEMEVYNG